MKLVENWRRVLTRAWSVQLMYFAALLDLAAQLVPYVGDVVPWWMSVLIILAAILVRPIKQNSVSGDGDEEE